jgi:hypothetical protein
MFPVTKFVKLLRVVKFGLSPAAFLPPQKKNGGPFPARRAFQIFAPVNAGRRHGAKFNYSTASGLGLLTGRICARLSA